MTKNNLPGLKGLEELGLGLYGIGLETPLGRTLPPELTTSLKCLSSSISKLKTGFKHYVSGRPNVKKLFKKKKIPRTHARTRT